MTMNLRDKQNIQIDSCLDKNKVRIIMQRKSNRKWKIR